MDQPAMSSNAEKDRDHRVEIAVRDYLECNQKDSICVKAVLTALYNEAYAAGKRSKTPYVPIDVIVAMRAANQDLNGRNNLIATALSHHDKGQPSK